MQLPVQSPVRPLPAEPWEATGRAGRAGRHRPGLRRSPTSTTSPCATTSPSPTDKARGEEHGVVGHHGDAEYGSRTVTTRAPPAEPLSRARPTGTRSWRPRRSGHPGRALRRPRPSSGPGPATSKPSSRAERAASLTAAPDRRGDRRGAPLAGAAHIGPVGLRQKPPGPGRGPADLDRRLLDTSVAASSH